MRQINKSIYRKVCSKVCCRLLVGLIGLLAAVWFGFTSPPTVAAPPIELAPFNQPSFYPLSQSLPAEYYRPVADWVGRLILPDLPTADRANPVSAATPQDWVEFEVYQAPAPYQALLGQTLKLTWQAKLLPQAARLTRAVAFTPDVEASMAKGNLHPTRLNGHPVGPLQSLAGARPQDDVIVSLTDVEVEPAAPPASATLRIQQPPIQRTGRYYSLVQIQANLPGSAASVPSDCPGAQPCPSELFRVQHYNLKTRQFDGPAEIVRIPQQPRSRIGLFNSTQRDLAESAAGGAGWYLFGAQDEAGLFTVQAIQPRALFQVQPQQVVAGQQAIWRYIHNDNWAKTQQRKGTLDSALLDPTASSKADLSQGQENQWQEGQRFLLMHLFGGRGGLQGESPLAGTVPGHFAYGTAQIIREPLADELQFDLTYEQVYGSNIEGIISGSQSWATFMGNLQSGWLATRPVSDVLINLDSITRDYQFGEVTLSPLQTLLQELQIITARYRIGDGTGGAIVTPATSCVQDSNQALFITIQRLQQVAQTPAIQTWLADHAADPDVRRFQDLISLGRDLKRTLMPLGIVRADWQQNARVLTGTGQFAHTAPAGPANLLAGLTSWRTILPRGTQDDLSLVLLRHQAQLWFLRTNQVGGQNPDIFPIAPTRQFGVWTLGNLPLLSLLVERVIGAIRLPSASDWRVLGLALLAYGAVALPLGLRAGFLQLPSRFSQPSLALTPTSARRLLANFGLALRLLLFPALGEELLFRVLLLPYPGTYLSLASWWAWASLSLGLYVLYHPMNAKTCYRAGFPTFVNPTFLVLTTALGLTCTTAYYLTQSWLVIALIHWIVVLVWIFLLGGADRLSPKD